MLNIQSILLIVACVIYFNIYIYTYYFQKKALAFKKEFFPPLKDENESAAISGVKRDINHHHGLVRFRLRR